MLADPSHPPRVSEMSVFSTSRVRDCLHCVCGVFGSPTNCIQHQVFIRPAFRDPRRQCPRFEAVEPAYVGKVAIEWMRRSTWRLAQSRQLTLAYNRALCRRSKGVKKTNRNR
uniref:Uncharacterized protein n=1 Tax=Panagrellus redivivus TaxID=6233 RepID=A0A7E4W101_PANRE